MGVYAVLLDRSGAHLRGLTDPAGGTFDAAGDFDRLLGEDGSLPVWSSIDLCGDTTLTTEQVEALLSELPDVIARSMEGPERHGLQRLDVMPHACRSDSSLTLRMVGRR